VLGWVVKKCQKNHDRKRARRSWVALVIFVIGLGAVYPQPASSGSKDDTTGTVSKAEPPIKQDGSPAHPYADASQCPSGRSIPSLPPGHIGLFRRRPVVQR
jgi:hypothetical protein